MYMDWAIWNKCYFDFTPINPFFKLYTRDGDEGEMIPKDKSKVLKSNSSPSYNCEFLWRKICTNYDTQLIFKIYTKLPIGGNKYYGWFQTSISEMQEAVSQGEEISFKLENDIKTFDNWICNIDNFILEERPNFSDFLKSEWQLNLIVAIDFTSSNLDSTDPHSLHYIHPDGNLNDYQEAITRIGNILERYTKKRKYASFGFGAIPKHRPVEGDFHDLFALTGVKNNKVSHCFNLNGLQNPEVEGVDGILEAYEYTLKNCRLYGPTFF